MDKPNNAWKMLVGDGPVIAAAVHDGHRLDDDFAERMALSEEVRRRDEDPLTGLWTSCGDTVILVRQSRFQLDLNRSVKRCVPITPEDAWGLHVWKEPPTAEMIERSRRAHGIFYKSMSELIEKQLERFGALLVLDIHSYNHRRDGPDAEPADPADNPDVDLGVTTLDRERWGDIIDCFHERLGQCRYQDRELDVRENVRYPDGGHFPEWIHATYGSDVAALTLEFKKFYMDEWTAMADLSVCADLRIAVEDAVVRARRLLSDR